MGIKQFGPQVQALSGDKAVCRGALARRHGRNGEFGENHLERDVAFEFHNLHPAQD